MHKRLLSFFLSPADVGIEMYGAKEIAELMKPIDPVRDDDLLSFAQAISTILEELSEETTTVTKTTCRQ